MPSISIHAPREGSDADTLAKSQAAVAFLSTLPVRGATANTLTQTDTVSFLSTLPVRGATSDIASAFAGLLDFYPRSP